VCSSDLHFRLPALAQDQRPLVHSFDGRICSVVTGFLALMGTRFFTFCTRGIIVTIGGIVQEEKVIRE
jgi:hypothetical protein